jgi:hypothetical protein
MKMNNVLHLIQGYLRGYGQFVGQTNVQVEKFLVNIKRADQNKAVHIGWNRQAGGVFFSKSINVLTKRRPCRGEFFLKINKCLCTSIGYTKVVNKTIL